MAHNFNTIEGTEVFNVNDAVQGSHALTLDDVKNFVGSGADKFHTNIVGTASYDPLLPLTGWVAPSSPIAGNTAEVKFTDGTVGNYTFDGSVWGLDFVDSTATAQRTWIKIGNTTETSATDVLKTDDIYHIGKTTIGSSLNPLGILHVGDLNNVNSTKPGILLSKNINTTGVAEHGLVDNSILNNSQSYNSFDARININSNLLGSGDHYCAFQSIPVLNSGLTIDTYYGVFDRLANSGTVKNYFGASYLTPLGNCDNYIGVNVNRSGASTQSIFSTGFVAGNLNAPDVVGLDVFSLNGSNKTYGVRVANLLGNNRRPIYTKVEQSGVFSPNEFYYNNSGSADLLMFSRSSVGNGDYLGVLWEAGSGATKYYSNRFASSYDSSLRGDFVFHTNSTGASGLAALTEKARIQYDGSIIHQGYHQYTSTFPTSGAGVPNGSQFKGTDGALYYKGDGGTVTLVAPN